MAKDYDFAGYVTKNDMLCSDGVVIKHSAFSENEGKKVPLVWNHNHNDPENVLGHVILHNDDNGVYGFGSFNKSKKAQHAAELLEHGDIASMSIGANRIKRSGRDVIHGNIYEVSLVLAGANPGAMIDEIITHSDGSEDALIYSDSIIHAMDYSNIDLAHADDETNEEQTNENDQGELDEETTQAINDFAESLSQDELQQVYDYVRSLVGDDVPDDQLMNALSQEQIDDVSDFILNLVENDEETDENSEAEDEEVEHADDENEDDEDDEDDEDIDPDELAQQVAGSLTEDELQQVYEYARTLVDDDVPDEEIMENLNDEDVNKVSDFIVNLLNEDVDNNEEEENDMKQNVFNGQEAEGLDVLTHADMEEIFRDAKRLGSLKESVLEHTDGQGIMHADVTGTYGMDHIDYLFPDAKLINNKPEFISREMSWVQKVMGATHHTPLSRIKTVFADITMDEARAKGYIKGNKKADEVFTLLKRETTPTTIYKKQKLDRDDIIDVTDMDVVAWLKSEMRVMLDEEIARAILIGDGRLASAADKINESNIRPIATDDDLYTVKVDVNVAAGATDDAKAKAFIKAAIKNRKLYKGSGNPTLFTTEDVLTSCLLLEDTNQRVIYDTVERLATALRVKEIITVEPMETVDNLMGIIVNLQDYNVGADKGGAVSLFDDFDIDYNQQKYLIETRCSGALIKPYSAMTLKLNEATTSSAQG